MEDVSPAIAACNQQSARSFEFAINGSAGASVSKTLAKGGYELVCSVDCILRSDGTAAAALPSTQPAANAPNASRKMLAGIAVPFDMPADGTVQVLGATTSGGTFTVSGPFIRGSLR